jgi:photosystem II stability/assembly factor-like uncharacterized protein
MPPSGGAVPAGFSPVSFTAVSAQQYWLLGEAPCANPVCTSIVRTTDGGARFVGIPAPQAPLASSGATGSGSGIDTLRFADALDGYAFASSPGGSLWETHDGGAQWSEPSFVATKTVMGFATAGGYAFALVGSCQGGTCSGVALERAAVQSANWSEISLPVPSGVSQVADMTVHGSKIWISLTTAVAQANQLLVIGTGSGAHFSTSQSPCYAGLGGAIMASSDSVLWAVCPTGNLGEVFRSTDGGQHWSVLQGAGEIANGAVMAPASDTTAVLEPSSQAQLLRTTDGGSTWTSVPGTSANGPAWTWIGFTDSSVGSALREQTGPSSAQLWRTSDGGASWTGPVPIR